MSIDLLEQRLENLSVAAPDAGRVTARVLSRVAERRRRRWPRIAALGVANVALLLLAAYFVPAADAVLADTPIAGDLLRDAGLAGAANRVTSVGAVATSSGYRLQLVGAYADSTRTVLLVHSQPAVWLGPGPMTLTDQFGRTYRMQGAIGNALTGNLIFEFEALAWPDAITGARITLYVTGVAPVNCTGLQSADPADVTCTNPGPPVAGTWTLPATLGVDEDIALALPAPAQLGPAKFRFVSVRSSSATIAVDIEVTGVTSEELSRRIPDGKKGIEVFTISVFGPNGEIVNGNGGNFPNEQGVHLHVYGYRVAPGEYHVHATYQGYGEFDRVLRVP